MDKDLQVFEHLTGMLPVPMLTFTWQKTTEDQHWQVCGKDGWANDLKHPLNLGPAASLRPNHGEAIVPHMCLLMHLRNCVHARMRAHTHAHIPMQSGDVQHV